MQFKSILAPIGGTDADTANLTLAARIARRFSAHIDVLHAKADPRESESFSAVTITWSISAGDAPSPR